MIFITCHIDSPASGEVFYLAPGVDHLTECLKRVSVIVNTFGGMGTTGVTSCKGSNKRLFRNAKVVGLPFLSNALFSLYNLCRYSLCLPLPMALSLSLSGDPSFALATPHFSARCPILRRPRSPTDTHSAAPSCAANPLPASLVTLP